MSERLRPPATLSQPPGCPCRVSELHRTETRTALPRDVSHQHITGAKRYKKGKADVLLAPNQHSYLHTTTIRDLSTTPTFGRVLKPLGSRSPRLRGKRFQDDNLDVVPTLFFFASPLLPTLPLHNITTTSTTKDDTPERSQSKQHGATPA